VGRKSHEDVGPSGSNCWRLASAPKRNTCHAKNRQLDAALPPNKMAQASDLTTPGPHHSVQRSYCELMGETQTIEGLLLVDVLRRRAAAGGFCRSGGSMFVILAKGGAGEMRRWRCREPKQNRISGRAPPIAAPAGSRPSRISPSAPRRNSNVIATVHSPD